MHLSRAFYYYCEIWHDIIKLTDADLKHIESFELFNSGRGLDSYCYLLAESWSFAAYFIACFNFNNFHIWLEECMIAAEYSPNIWWTYRSIQLLSPKMDAYLFLVAFPICFCSVCSSNHSVTKTCVWKCVSCWFGWCRWLK